MHEYALGQRDNWKKQFSGVTSHYKLRAGIYGQEVLFLETRIFFEHRYSASFHSESSGDHLNLTS